MPVTEAAKVIDCAFVSEAMDGVTDTATAGTGATSVMLALAVLLVSATLVAFTVTVCAEVIVTGAV